MSMCPPRASREMGMKAIRGGEGAGGVLAGAAPLQTVPPSTTRCCAVTIRLSSAASQSTMRAISGG